MSLVKKFYNDRYLHIRSFSVNFAVSACMCALLYHFHNPEFYQFHVSPWHLALIPLGIYVGGMSAVFIHNATHDSFPNHWLNEACGYLAGMHQLWGFMGWKLIHLVHHLYSDNVAMDPHPPADKSFWDFTKVMFLHSSAIISERYREHWGTGLRTAILHKSVLVTFTALAACNLLFWYLLLGPVVFVFFYVPSYAANHLLFADVNYSAHPKDPVTGETKPGNLNHNLYYKLANLMWCGIYFHGNHHRRPNLFNPKRMQATQRDGDDLQKAA